MKKYIPIKQDSAEAVQKKPLSKDLSTRLTNYYHEKEKYYPIERGLLVVGSEISFSLFAKTDFDYSKMLEASESSPAKISAEVLDIKGDISIKVSDLLLYNEYIKSLDKSLDTIEPDDKIKVSLVKEKTKLIVKNILSHPKSGENIKEASPVVELMINSILKSDNFLHELIALKNHDYYTYTHCVNVAVLSIGLGHAVNLPENDLFKLGLGALLHDIGKTAIPVNILNKLGRLTSGEYEIMKTHVIEGVKILEENPYFPKESLDTVSQHHERLTGKGYPLHLTGSRISKYGKIIGITDSYEALTTERPTKEAYIPFEALSIIVNDCENYDSEYLTAFIKMLGRLEK